MNYEKPYHNDNSGITSVSQGGERILSDIHNLMKEQNNLLRSLLEIPRERETPLQPPAPVPARSSSAWNALLASVIRNTEPTLERWRGGLDTLLIFVGFFSSIVTSFLVESLKNLRVDPTSRTNELLANLTEVTIALSSGSKIPTTPPKPFAPDPGDVRLNAFWSLALIISICAAALAVAGRGFLALLIRSDGDAVTKLTEFHQRHTQAKLRLGIFLEALPQILLIPFLLFIIGLLDNLLSSSLATRNPIIPTLISSIISCMTVVAVGILLFCAVIHGIFYPESSPFQTIISGSHSFRHMLKGFLEYSEERELSVLNREIFHMALQETYDDDLLHQASAAMEDVVFGNAHRGFAGYFVSLTDQEAHSVLHLLSPEASLRNNLTAARMIQQIEFVSPFHRIPETNYLKSVDRQASLLLALLAAAARHRNNWTRPLEQYPESVFTNAMAALIPGVSSRFDTFPLVGLLLAHYYTLQPLPQKMIEACNATMSYVLSSLTNSLPRLKGSKRDWSEMINSLRNILGPCSLVPPLGTEFLLSLMVEPPLLVKKDRNTLDSDSITDLLCHWVSTGQHANNTAAYVIETVQRQGAIMEGPARDRAILIIMRFVFHSTLYSASQQTLDFCTTFILSAQGTAIWNENHWILLFIHRFLEISEEVLDNIQESDTTWKNCRCSLAYIYKWTQYCSEGFGKLITTFFHFQRRVGSKEEFLMRTQNVYARLNTKAAFHADQSLPLSLVEE